MSDIIEFILGLMSIPLWIIANNVMEINQRLKEQNDEADLNEEEGEDGENG